jgi:uncharacterized protein YjiS (DUF1127 family)
MTTFAHAPAAPMRGETQAASHAARGRAPPVAGDSLARQDRQASVAADAQLPASPLGRLAATTRLWWRRSQESRELLEMPDTALRDIGISRSEAWQASRKPFWRA